jgi:hypothetical protein
MTTSQTYQTDDDQQMPEHDQATSEGNLIEPDASLVAPEPDLAERDAELAEPDADLATAERDPAEPDSDPMAPDSGLPEPNADHAAHEDLMSDPAGPIALADSEPASSMVSGYPGFIPDGDDRVGEEPGTAGNGAGSPSLISGAFTVPESVPDSDSAGDTVRAAGPWNEIQAMFVDDPRASIERAAGLVDDRVKELIDSVRERQRSVQAAWQADDAGTEELRVALQHYRTFWNSFDDLPAEA